MRRILIFIPKFTVNMPVEGPCMKNNVFRKRNFNLGPDKEFLSIGFDIH